MANYLNHNNKYFQVAVSIVIHSFAGSIIFLYLYFAWSGKFPAIQAQWMGYLAALLIANLLGFGFLFITRLFQKIWSWHRLPLTRIAVQLFALTFLGFYAVNWLVQPLIRYISDINNQPLPSINYNDLLIRYVIILFAVVLIYTLTQYLLYSYRNYMNRKVNAIENQREKLTLQFEMLQKQLSPHYLFNSLNTISNLIETNAEKSEEYIRNLVKTYKYILQMSNQDLVTLHDELKMIRAYEFQLKTRFGDLIQWKYTVSDESERKKLPPLSLQILIENAVKHNVATNETPLTLEITTKNNHVVVRNNITHSPAQVNSNKIGLDNLKKRYSLLGKTNMKVEKNDFYSVYLPLI